MSANPTSRSPERSLHALRVNAGATAASRMHRLDEAVLRVSSTSPSSFAFELRSRLNARLLVGGPVGIDGSLAASAEALLERSRHESAFRIDARADGMRVVRLVDEAGCDAGTSEPIANDAMARVILKLIVSQARCARVELTS